jgi:hypothetical protein
MSNLTVYLIARKVRGENNFHFDECKYFQGRSFAEDYLMRINEANSYDIIELTFNPGLDPEQSPVINSLVSEYIYYNSEITYTGPKYCRINELEIVLGQDTTFKAAYYLDTTTIGIEAGLEIAKKAFMANLALTQYYSIDCESTDFEKIDIMYLDLESSFYFNRVYDNGELIGLIDSNGIQFYIPFIEGTDLERKKHFIKTINQNTKIMLEIKLVQAKLKQRLEDSEGY